MGNKLHRSSGNGKEEDFRLVYRIGPKLGEGAFGVVHECCRRDAKPGDQPLAVKMIDRVESDTSDIEREVRIMMALEHDNVLKCQNIFVEKCFVCIIMPKLDGGDLVDGLQLHLRMHGKIPEPTVCQLSLQILNAVNHVHQRGFIHRDIKGDNLLLDRPDVSDPKCHIVLSDFGTACPHDGTKTLRQVTGTRVFWAPEVVKRAYSFPADVWASGVVIYGLVDATFPFRDEKQILEKVPKIPSRASPEGKDFLVRILDKDPATRLTLAQSLDHSMLKKNLGEQYAGAGATTKNGVTAGAGATDSSMVSKKELGEAASEAQAVAVDRDHVPQAMALRRKELAQAYHQAAPGHDCTKDFIAEGLRAGEFIEYKWIPTAEAKHDISGMKKENAKQLIWTPKGVEQMLEASGISTASFGQGKAKSVEELCAEIQSGECSLMNDCTGLHSAKSKIVRVVEVVLLRLRRSEKDSSPILIQAKEKYSDGRENERWRLPGAKMRPNENVKTTTTRIIESIGLDKTKVSFKYTDREVMEEKEDSPSYPGVATVYRKHIVEGNVLSLALKPEQVEIIGGQKNGQFVSKNAESGEVNTWSWLTAKEAVRKNKGKRTRDKVNFWSWLTAKEAVRKNKGKRTRHKANIWSWLTAKEAVRKNKALKLSGTKASSDTSGLVSANLKIDEEQLKKMLKENGISIDAFGTNGARSLHEFAQEIARGESHLQEVPVTAGGKETRLMRVTDIVLLKIENNNRVLLEAARHNERTGSRAEKNQLPGAKSRPNENTYTTGKRIATVLLNIKEEQITFGSHTLVEEESDSAAYPGVRTLYRKHIISAKVDA